MGAAIPTKAREVIRTRQGGQCARCGSTYAELHHRQRRREGGHGYDVLVGLCSTDHKWAHANPAAAKARGYIVPVHIEDVSSIPILTFMGWMLFTKDGDMVAVGDN